MLENDVKGKMLNVISIIVKNDMKREEVKKRVMVLYKNEVVKNCWKGIVIKGCLNKVNENDENFEKVYKVVFVDVIKVVVV